MNDAQSPRPVRLHGILFAWAANLLLVTAGLFLGSALGGSTVLLNVTVLGGAFLAGILTGVWVGTRAGIHAFVGGLLSAPVLALWIFPHTNWRYGILSGAVCALGGILMELRERAQSQGH